MGSNPIPSASNFFVPLIIYYKINYSKLVIWEKKKTIHYLYKTTCIITGRYYIGIHSTNDLEDGYLGSGKRLRRSIRKYGENNHTREILSFYDTRELLIEDEKEIITEDMIDDLMCMNLKGGGNGVKIKIDDIKIDLEYDRLVELYVLLDLKFKNDKNLCDELKYLPQTLVE